MATPPPVPPPGPPPPMPLSVGVPMQTPRHPMAMSHGEVPSLSDAPGGQNEGRKVSRKTAKGGRGTAQRGRSFLNHQQRLEIIKKKDEEPKWTQTQLARWATVYFNLPKEPSQATIAILLKKRDQIKAATVNPETRTIRSPRHPELEAALLLWVRFLQSKRVPFTGENIRLKASFLAKQLGIDTNLNFSTGWMSGFVNRHNLILARAHKKKQVENDEEPVRSILKNYDPRDVFAMDETTLIYNDLPYDGEHADQANPDRDRFCIGLAVNMDGSERLEPLVVTTTRRKISVLSDTYYNIDGNMTGRIFEQWLYKLNQHMASLHRKIVLLVDTAPSHFPLVLSNIRLVLLSYKVAQRTQPLEAGITKSFKALYRKTHLSFAVDQAEEGRTRIFDVSIPRALLWVKQAWQDVAHELVRNCWARTGLLTSREQIIASDSADIHPEVVQSLVVSLSQLQLLETVPIETLLNPRSEEDAHYVYDDATVVRIVAGESLPDEAQAGEDSGDIDMGNGESGFANEDEATSRFQDDAHIFEREPTIPELLGNYRGVIWSLDGESDGSEEHLAVLRFLRRKQAALRLQLQQQQQRQKNALGLHDAATPAVSAPSSSTAHEESYALDAAPGTIAEQNPEGISTDPIPASMDDAVTQETQVV